MYEYIFADKDEKRKPKKIRTKNITLLIVLLLLVLAVIGGTVAYLLTETPSIVNTFTPSKVKTEITEEFDGQVKKNVNVKNTGDISAYVRVKLVSYRVNDAGERIGGLANVPAFTPNNGWVEHGGFYYYTQPVAAGSQPATNLVDSLTLVEYDDADGGKQVIEVLAEAIQSDPAKASQDAWGVTIAPGSVTPYTGS